MSKYLIIGGVAGGATVAARLRRIDEKAEIIMFERGKYISYANCGLPYHVGEVIKERENLFVQTPESFGKRFDMEVRVLSEVISIDKENKSVQVKNLETGEEYTEKYDNLVLSPGAEPVVPPIQGIKNDKIFTLRNVPDTDKIKGYVDNNKPKKAVVVGAGFIGLEMAENLHHRGLQVTIVEMGDQVMNPIDYEMAAEVHQHLKMKNVEFYLKDGVNKFINKDGKLTVVLGSGKKIEADMVILSIGVRPDDKLAREAGLKLGERGGIWVDEYLRTSDKNIYAIGDAIVFTNPIIGKSMTAYLAGPANRQGRLCADNIVDGNKRKYSGSILTAIAKIFDITVAATGIAGKVLYREGIDHISSITHSSSHAGYYPGAIPLTIKIVFDGETGKLFGAQVVGYEGVDKRIDVIAAVLKSGGTIYDLQDIEHAYAPPYSSAKDPVAIAAYAAENIINGRMKIIPWYKMKDVDPIATQIIDVRTPEEFSIGAMNGAINIPVDDMRDRLDEIDKNRQVIVYCGIGQRAYLAYRILVQNGFNDVLNLSGGFKTYEHTLQKQSNEDLFGGDYVGVDNIIYQADTNSKENTKEIEVDACGLQCPGPIMKLKEEMDELPLGGILKITASDPGFYKDVSAWCNVTKNSLVKLDTDKGNIIATIKKAGSSEKVNTEISTTGDDKTMIVFSDDFDKALATFVIANGAVATGKKVTLFFTFWGLNTIRKENIKKIGKKDFLSNVFDKIMPKGSHGLKLSKFNGAGFGTKMMRGRMGNLNIDSLETMIQHAMKNGVEFVACQMSMDMFGIKEDELIDGVKIGGVASFLEATESSNMSLFI